MESQSPGPLTTSLTGLLGRTFWLTLGGIALLVIVFGVGALYGCASATGQTASAGENVEQATIAAIQAVSPSVVEVQAKSSRGQGVGSGEILTTSGYIVTNDHVVRGFSAFTVLLSNGATISARLVGEAPSEDLAVLKINAPNLKPIAIGNSNTLRLGTYVLALGSPLGLEQSVTSGIVSALNRRANETVDGSTVTLSGLIQTSAPINPGNSGGALIDLQGKLIGIPTLGVVDPISGAAANGIGFAIASSHMQAVVSKLTQGAA